MVILLENDKYKLRFEASFSSLTHFCTAREMHDVRVSMYRSKDAFGMTAVKNTDELPEELLELFLEKIKMSLHNDALEEPDDEDDEQYTKYLLAAIHVKPGSHWSYGEYCVGNKWLFDNIAKNSMLIEEDSYEDMELRQFLVTHSSTHYNSSIASKSINDLYPPADPEPKAPALTESLLNEYLNNL